MPEKIDFKKTLDGYQAGRGEFRVLDLPPMSCLTLSGQGDPNSSPAFSASIETLYPVAYAVKFASKRELGRDYVVPPLEGLWWADDMAAFTARRDKNQWRWTLLLLVPEWVEEDMVEQALSRVGAKDPRPPRLDDVRVETLAEGCCVQTLHVGSFDDEAPVLAELHDRFLPSQGLRPTGKHHEIYLSDFRRVPPERQRTILRQPVLQENRD